WTVADLPDIRPNLLPTLVGQAKPRGAAMFDLNRLLNVLSPRAEATFHRMLDWKLLRGSHEFPGPDGGTCINEAAIVAAGYPYRAVYCVKDLPASFSRPIAMLALCLNDTLEDDLRQELLMPFVTRLAGSADSPKPGMTRAELTLQRTVSEILAPALTRAGLADVAERCRAVRTPTELVEIARRMRDCAGSGLPQSLLSALEHAADAGRQWLAGLPTEVVFCTFSALREIASLERDRGAAYRQAGAVPPAAIEIGNRADDGDMPVVAKRMHAAKRRTAAARREGGLVAVWSAP